MPWDLKLSGKITCINLSSVHLLRFGIGINWFVLWKGRPWIKSRKLGEAAALHHLSRASFHKSSDTEKGRRWLMARTKNVWSPSGGPLRGAPIADTHRAERDPPVKHAWRSPWPASDCKDKTHRGWKRQARIHDAFIFSQKLSPLFVYKIMGGLVIDVIMFWHNHVDGKSIDTTESLKPHLLGSWWWLSTRPVLNIVGPTKLLIHRPFGYSANVLTGW